MEAWQVYAIQAGAGVLMLGWGRKMYWFFIGTFGFLCGKELIQMSGYDMPVNVQIIISIVIGLFCVMLACFLQKLVLCLAGFILGGYAAMALVSALGWSVGWAPAVMFVLGGLTGVIMIIVLFEWALIGFSCLLGAMLLSGIFLLENPYDVWLTAGLFSIGFIFQESRRRGAAS